TPSDSVCSRSTSPKPLSRSFLRTFGAASGDLEGRGSIEVGLIVGPWGKEDGGRLGGGREARRRA
ncbi:hypothetical protein RUND412_011644, partial [Rhizina undulata]